MKTPLAGQFVMESVCDKVRSVKTRRDETQERGGGQTKPAEGETINFSFTAATLHTSEGRYDDEEE